MPEHDRTPSADTAKMRRMHPNDVGARDLDRWADEIERLRAEVEGLREALQQCTFKSVARLSFTAEPQGEPERECVVYGSIPDIQMLGRLLTDREVEWSFSEDRSQ